MLQNTKTELLYEEALNKGKALFVTGETINYIELQLADKKYPDQVIDQVIIDIGRMMKQARRKKGLQRIIFGSTIITVACVVTYLSFHSNSPIGIFMAGTGIAGVLVLAKGIWDILGLK